MSPALSVIVCTKNRIEALRRCVDALFTTRSKENWELIVVDNGSTDGTMAFLQTLQPPRANISVVVRMESKPGAGNARECGWRSAASDLISYIDDDCYVTETYIDNVLATFDRNPDVGFFGGRVVL
jgi:glycosyltransferase involved in cell wall biosynthesis